MQPYASLSSIFITSPFENAEFEGGRVISSNSGTEPWPGPGTVSCFGDFITCFTSKEPNKNPVMNVRTANNSHAVMEIKRTSTSDSDSVAKGKLKKTYI